MKISFNGHLILKPYTAVKELKEKQINRGLVGTENKVGVKSLELLVDSMLNISHNAHRVVSKGAKIYFRESTLHSQKWPREIHESEEFPEGFVIGSQNDILFIEEE